MEIEKLIKHMREEAQDYRSGRTLGRAFADAEDVLDEAATALEQLRDESEKLKAQVPRWIPVEERLPEPGERVLATDCGFVGEFYINKRGKWQRYNVNCSELLMALDILYWMPLPAPPDRRPPEGEEET